MTGAKVGLWLGCHGYLLPVAALPIASFTLWHLHFNEVKLWKGKSHALLPCYFNCFLFCRCLFSDVQELTKVSLQQDKLFH